MRLLFLTLFIASVYSFDYQNYTIAYMNTAYKEISGKSCNIYKLVENVYSFDQLVDGINHHFLMLLNNTEISILSLHYFVVNSDFNETLLDVITHINPKTISDDQSGYLIVEAMSKTLNQSKVIIQDYQTYRQDFTFPALGVVNVTEPINFSLIYAEVDYDSNHYYVYNLLKNNETQYLVNKSSEYISRLTSLLFPIVITIIITILITFLALYAYISRNQVPFTKQIDQFDPRSLGVESESSK